MNTLGERIAYHRKNCGMTQEQLAEKCSVSPQAVSKWENDLSAPDISLIPKLAELFRVTTDELLGVKKAETVAVNPEFVDLTKMLLKMRVLSARGDKVNINLPLSIAQALLENGKLIDSVTDGKDGKFNFFKEINFAQILSLVQMGAMGKLMEVESANGDVVEVWVE